MGADERLRRVRDLYAAFASGDRAVAEAAIADEFRFSSPVDVGLDRAGYFERCWPNSGRVRRFEFVRLAPVGDEVLVTYEAQRADGERFRNTEIVAFDGDRIAAVEVYFGWSL